MGVIVNIKLVSSNGYAVEFGLKSKIVISSINVSGLPLGMVMSQGVGQIGTTIQATTIPHKDILVTGQIIGDSKGYKKQLANAIVPNVGCKLIWNEKWEIVGLPITLLKIDSYVRDSKFSFTLRAAYPYWQSVKMQQSSIVGMEAMFMFPWDSGIEHMYGKRTETLFASVVNGGNVPTNFILTFMAQTTLTNPEITLIETMEKIKINKTMNAGEVITIDMTKSPMSVISSTDGNIFGLLDLDSVPFMLEVGENIIKYDAEVNRDGLESFLTFSASLTMPYEE